MDDSLQARLLSEALSNSGRRDEAIFGLLVTGLGAEEIAVKLDCTTAEVTTSVERAKAKRPAMDRREMRVTYELHRAVAEKLDEDPGWIVERALGHAVVMKERQRDPMSKGWMTEWEEWLHGDVEELKRSMLATGFHAEDMRQMSPFLGVLTQDERVLAIHKAGLTAQV